MQGKSINLAIVLDEYGLTAGMVTMEDLLEEIVGDIRDEYDANEDAEMIPISDTVFLVSGSMNLEDLCRELGLHLTSDDYDTIGGFFIESCDHLPEEGESVITDDQVRLTVVSVSKNRIEQLQIEIPEPTVSS